MYADFNTVAGGVGRPSLNEPQANLNGYVRPMMTDNFATDNGNALSAYRATVVGDCTLNMNLAQCGGARGVVPHADQYIEQNDVQLMRENDGKVIRFDYGSLPPQ
jgi:hypothetical protein